MSITSNTKNTIKSVLVLAAIVFVAVTMLVVINEILPKAVAKLDDRTKDIIREFMPADDYDFYDGFIKGYGDYSADDTNALSSFNKKEGTSNNTVVGIYVAVGGQYDGNFVVESTGQGWASNDTMKILTGYNKDNKIIGTRLKDGKETASSGTQAYERPDFYPSFEGKGDGLTAGDITAESGATASATVAGYVKAVNLATTLVQLLDGAKVEVPTWKEVTDKENTLLKEIYRDDVTYAKADKNLAVYKQAISQELAVDMVAAYVIVDDLSDDTVIYEGKASADSHNESYGDISLMMIVGKDEANNAIISRVIVGTIDGHENDVDEGANSNDVINSALQALEGLSIADIKDMDYHDLDGQSGASETAKGILSAAATTAAMYYNIDVGQLLEGGIDIPITWGTVSDSAVVAKLQAVYDDSGYSVASKHALVAWEAIGSDVEHLVAIYKSNDGTIIIEGGGDFGIRYGNISLMTVITDNKISEIGVGTIDNHVNSSNFPSDTTISITLEYLKGKSLADIDFDDIDLSAIGNATASNSVLGMIESIKAVFDIHSKLAYNKLP